MRPIEVVIRVYAALLGSIGLIFVGGGAYLIAPDGSFYYLLCGFALLASGVLLWRRRAEGAETPLRGSQIIA